MDFSIPELKKRVRLLEHELRQLKASATQDALTGLLNRRGFNELAEKLFQEARRAMQGKDKREHFWIDAVSLVIFDIDDFKQINDRYGHRFGDQILQYTASEISKHIRNSDVLARIGGEKIALLLVGADSFAARRVADEIRRGISAHVKKLKKLPNFKLTVSVGVAGLNEKIKSFDELFRKADAALYEAKKTGKK